MMHLLEIIQRTKCDTEASYIIEKLEYDMNPRRSS